MNIDVPTPSRHGISLTPLIDVVFILLIFFMLASSFDQWKGVELTMGQTQEDVPSDLPELTIIQIEADSSWRYQHQQIEPEDMLAQLQKTQQSGKKLSIFLQPLSGVQVQSLVDALGLLRERGFNKVGLVREAE